MSGKGAGVVVADHSTYKLVEPTTRSVAGTRTPSFKRPQEESGHYPWLGGYLQWLNGKEAREEYYGRLDRISGR
jgi:hypothetical protein